VDRPVFLQYLKSNLWSILLVGTFCGVCEAPQPPAEPSAGDRDKLAEAYVRQKLAQWQDRLKLQDWTVTLVASHPGDLRPGTLGNISWDEEKKTARIRVLRASDYQAPFRATLRDMEFTVVHELIHLEFSGVTRNEESRSAESRTAEEEAVNRMAETLLRLDRQN
jgi:hypothetical protein